MKFRRSLLFPSFFFVLFLFRPPLTSFAASTTTDYGFFVPEGGFVPCGTGANPEECNFCHLFELGQNIIDYVLKTYIPLFALVFIFYAGFLLLTSAGNEERVKQARSVITNVFIGLFIALAAWMAVNLLMTTLFNDEIAGSWSNFECK